MPRSAARPRTRRRNLLGRTSPHCTTPSTRRCANGSPRPCPSASAQDASLADLLGDLYADAFERADEDDLRRWLLARLRTTADPRAERYWQLLATINGWPTSPTLAPVHSWFTAAFAKSGEDHHEDHHEGLIR
ncbi:hypothetical protein [Streptomyces sp. NPDC048606]|uniref:hypothetical protein n=1 Tax=Streptomyces sp. NPDC048606 TaxID=3154726 RepID=UPI00342285F2